MLDCISDGAIVIDGVRAHDKRGISTSCALFQAAALDDVLRAADWVSADSFV